MTTDNLVWIDLEMTGLDPACHVIVEVATVITDTELNPIGETLDLVIHATEAELSEMDQVVTEMHQSNGLIDAIRHSSTTLKEAEDAVLALIAAHCTPSERPVLAGNSISTDRSFIRAYMPRLDEALHYRMIDVSSIKELSRRWFPRVYYQQPEKALTHRALDDIMASIRELDYYRRSVFVPAPGPSTPEAVNASREATEAYKNYL